MMMMLLMKTTHTHTQYVYGSYVKNILIFFLYKRFSCDDDDDGQTKVNGNVCHSFIHCNQKEKKSKNIYHHCWW